MPPDQSCHCEERSDVAISLSEGDSHAGQLAGSE